MRIHPRLSASAVETLPEEGEVGLPGLAEFWIGFAGGWAVWKFCSVLLPSSAFLEGANAPSILRDHESKRVSRCFQQVAERERVSTWPAKPL